jgi:hypothetical protein
MPKYEYHNFRCKRRHHKSVIARWEQRGWEFISMTSTKERLPWRMGRHDICTLRFKRAMETPHERSERLASEKAQPRERREAERAERGATRDERAEELVAKSREFASMAEDGAREAWRGAEPQLRKLLTKLKSRHD